MFKQTPDIVPLWKDTWNTFDKQTHVNQKGNNKNCKKQKYYKLQRMKLLFYKKAKERNEKKINKLMPQQTISFFLNNQQQTQT